MQRKVFFVSSWNELCEKYQTSGARAQALRKRNLTQHRSDETMQIFTMQIELNALPQRCMDSLSRLSKDERPNLSDPQYDLDIDVDQIKLICSDGEGFLSRVHEYDGKKVVHHFGCKLLDEDAKMKFKRRYLDDTNQVLVVPHWIYPGNKFPISFNGAREEMKGSLLLNNDGNYNAEYLIINNSDNNNNDAELVDEKKGNDDDTESISDKELSPDVGDWSSGLRFPTNDAYSSINRCLTYCQTVQLDRTGQVSIVYYNKKEKTGFYLIQTNKSMEASIKESKILRAIDGGNYNHIVQLIAVEGVKNHFNSNIVEYGDIDVVGVQRLLSLNWNALYRTSKKLLYEICKGLDCLYAHGLIHTRIGLATIGIFNGYFKIRDMSGVISFGDGVIDVDPTTAPPELLQKKIVKRTIEYDVDDKYHSWSLGLLLYEFLTGIAPIAIPTNGSINVQDLFRIYADQARLAGRFTVSAVLRVDPWVIDIITELFEMEPEDRISCRAVLENPSLTRETPSFPTALHEIGYRFPPTPNTETFECKKILKNGDNVINPYMV